MEIKPKELADGLDIGRRKGENEGPLLGFGVPLFNGEHRKGGNPDSDAR